MRVSIPGMRPETIEYQNRTIDGIPYSVAATLRGSVQPGLLTAMLHLQVHPRYPELRQALGADIPLRLTLESGDEDMAEDLNQAVGVIRALLSDRRCTAADDKVEDEYGDRVCGVHEEEGECPHRVGYALLARWDAYQEEQRKNDKSKKPVE